MNYSEFEKKQRVDDLLMVAGKWFGRPYIYGGNSYRGVDCSGFVCAVLKSIGLIGQKEDLSAQMLWDKFCHWQSIVPHKGGLVFWFKDGKAEHVAIVINDRMTIQSARGDSSLMIDEDHCIDEVASRAYEQNAMVDYVPINYRNGDRRFVRLF